MSFRDIILPLDCSGIDLEFELSADTVDELDDPDLLDNVMKIPDADNRLQAARDHNNTLIFIAQTDTHPSNITIKGEEYRVIAHAGNGGYGSTCIVAKDNPDGTESRFVLKEQNSNDIENLRVIKEAIINLCLNKATTVGTQPFFPTIHSVFFSKRNNFPRMYCLIDLLAVDGFKLISAPIDSVTRGTLILILFKQLIDRLKELYDKFQYNHGDLKPGNIMIDHNNNLRLIDFGMSRIVLTDSGQPVTLQLSEFNKNSTESTDLTLMAALINNQATGIISEPCKTFINTIDNGFNCKTNTWVRTAAPLSDAIKKPINCPLGAVTNMEQLYRYNDTNINPAGTFNAVKASYLDWASLPALDLSVYGFVPRRLIAPQGPRPIVAVLPLGPGPVVSMPGGAKLRRKTKSKRVYRKHAKSRRRKSKNV